MVTVAVVGAGGWGKNLVRNFAGLPDCRLKTVCDLDPAKLKQAKAANPELVTTREFGEVLADGEVEAVVIATPAPLHF